MVTPEKIVRCRTVLALVLCLLVARPAWSADDIVFSLDSRGHTAEVTALAFTPDGRDLVSASKDKTIRVWDLETGRTRRTFRGQIGPGPEGEVAAMALSSDGKWLASGGWMDPAQARVPCCGDVRLYDYASGELVTLLRAHNEPVRALAFSPDGTRLISGSTDGVLVFWDVATRSASHTAAAHGGEVFAIAFTPDGTRAVSASADKDLVLWRTSDGTELARMAGHKAKVFALAMSPKGDFIASADAAGEIRLWDSRDGRSLGVVADEGAQVRALSFLPSGEEIVTTLGHPPYEAHIRDRRTGAIRLTYRGHDDVVSAVAVKPDGSLVATAGGQKSEIHVWDAQTGVQAVAALRGTGATIRSLGIAAKDTTLAWGYTDPCPEERLSCPKNHGSLDHQISLQKAGDHLGELEKAPADQSSFRRAEEDTSGGLGLQHKVGPPHGYESVLEVTRDGKTTGSIRRDATSGYRHRAYTFTRQQNAVVSGGANGYLASYALDGQPLRRFIGHDGDILALATAADGPLMASGGSDQIIRIWNVESGELVANLFATTDDQWLMWTPQGYYTGSPGADELVGWQINKGRAKTPLYVRAAQLRDRLNRTDIVERAIALGSAEEAVRTAPRAAFELGELSHRSVPHIEIKARPDGLSAKPGYIALDIKLEDNPDPVKIMRVEVNGDLVGVVKPKKSGEPDPLNYSVLVPVASGLNTIVAMAINEVGEASDTLRVKSAEPGRLDTRGTLRVLAIGIDKYPAEPKRLPELRYAGADATLFAEAFARELGRYHTKTAIEVLVNGGPDGEPTASRIRSALDALRASEDNDTVLLFLAGHGVNDEANYRFMPTDAEKSGKYWSSDKSISWYALAEALQSAKGRRLVFVDTCHAGNAYDPKWLGNQAYHMNVLVYASARWDQLAQENEDLRHGIFTYALVEGIEGRAGSGTPLRVTTDSLSKFVSSRVNALARDLAQDPQYFVGRDAEDYPLTTIAPGRD